MFLIVRGTDVVDIVNEGFVGQSKIYRLDSPLMNNCTTTTRVRVSTLVHNVFYAVRYYLISVDAEVITWIALKYECEVVNSHIEDGFITITNDAAGRIC